MKLSDSQRKIILQRIEKLFETTKARLLGRYFKGPHIIFEVLGQSDPLDSIEGLYTWALAMMYGAGIRPDQKTIENLAEITGNYFDSQKLKVKNHILNAILAAKDHKEAMASVKDHFDKASKYVEMLTGNETRSVIAYANREGIARVGSDIGVSDPTIVFRGVIDDKLCLEENEEVEIITQKGGKWVKLKDLKPGDRIKRPFSSYNTTKKKWDGTVTTVEPRMAETIKLTIDNGAEIVCTPDHPILIKSGPIFHFIEAKFINESHYIVTKSDKLNGVKSSLRAREFMGDSIDSWDYIKNNIHHIMDDLEKNTLQSVLKKNNIPYKMGWEKYLRFIVKSYRPNLKIKRPSNYNNKLYIQKKTEQIQIFKKNKITEYNTLGNEWFVNEIKSGKSIGSVSKETKIPYGYLSARAKELNLMPIIKARGAKNAWEKHGKNLSEKLSLVQRGWLKVKYSKPERKCFEEVVKSGYKDAIHQKKILEMTVDMFIPSLSLVIEYDGSGHSRDKWFKAKKNARTQEQVDFSRDKRIKSLGYSILRIHSPSDIVPTSDEIKNKINEMVLNKMEFLKWHV